MSLVNTDSEKLSREELLEQRKELLSSIKYASFIQEAILPDKHFLDKVLNEHFILYLPRDIVSGDFYFCAKIENFVIVAAGDCTGHGVPGALMSIMGASFLNDILSGRGPWKPSRILNLLRERVMKALRQTGSEEENKDAMDMALCVFNEDTGELQYSGANNPLYHLRDGKLTEIKADKMPVGINAIDEESFTNHTVRLISDDIIYIFSDGYPDQFGGEYCKKFKYTPMKQLFTDISGKELHQQGEILEKRFYDWKGKNEQVDDILVFGIKFL
jgi:serine phosphatase RsbU (regulator of sigma subunit)